MIPENKKSYWYNIVLTACGLAYGFVFLKYAKRGKFLVRRKHQKKDRRYIRLSRYYRNQMHKCDGIKFCTASIALKHIGLTHKINVKINWISKRFKRRVLPWRLIRRRK